MDISFLLIGLLEELLVSAAGPVSADRRRLQKNVLRILARKTAPSTIRRPLERLLPGSHPETVGSKRKCDGQETKAIRS
jgi:hypothetical protein